MRDARVVEMAEAAVKTAGSIAAAAAAMGMSRPYLSRYLNDDLIGLDGIETAIKKFCDRRECPHTKIEITPDVCRRKALAPTPFGGTARLAQWNACQVCTNKPSEEKAK
jgi:hypothetical protein